jgi:hypothetical protein
VIHKSYLKKSFLVAVIAFIYQFLPNAAKADTPGSNLRELLMGSKEELASTKSTTESQFPPQPVDWRQRLSKKSIMTLQERLRQGRTSLQELQPVELQSVNKNREQISQAENRSNSSVSWIERLTKTPFSTNQVNTAVESQINLPSLTPSSLTNPALATLANQSDFTVFPVGVMVGKRNVLRSVLIRGKENGSEAVNFEDWLVPFDTVIDALKLDVKSLPDGQLEARSPGLVTRINPKTLQTDSELGLVFSIRDIQRLFGVTAKFDIEEYAIALDLPWLNRGGSTIGQNEAPIIFDGLPLLRPGSFNIAAVEQRVNAIGGSLNETNYRGDLQAVGTAFGGSWFLRTDQPTLGDNQTWRISEAQFLRQTNQNDYFLGSHPTFWQSQNSGNFWGFTLIQRQGFAPPQRFNAGFSDPRQRLQSAQIGRTVTGRAEPGTLVRLVEGFDERIIGEVFVDSSGTYRFENIKNQNQSFDSTYRVLLYPEGRLTAQPEIREATFSTVPGQIPAGASAWVASGGWRRRFDQNQGLFGNFDDFGGGIAARFGLSESITLGFGGVYDGSLRGLTELFYRPENFPLEVAVSALTGEKSDVIADVRFEPSRTFTATFTSDFLSRRFNLNWNLFRGFSLFGTADSRNATSGGMQFNFSGRDYSTFARVSLDTENRLRWNWLQRLGKMELNQRGNEIGTFSELTYNFSRSSITGHALLLNYETRSQNRNNNLLTLGWRYRSDQRANDGNYQWEAQLGYGIGSQGNGLVASLGTTVLPGIMLRARYQGISLTSDDASFSVDLVSSLNLQRGITPGDRRTNYLRTQGGIMIQPFYDSNNNGKRDANEKFYTENSETMLIVNNRPVKALRPEAGNDRINIRLNPGTYRLDLDPAGYPPDWQASNDAFAVNVVAGSYTPIMVPLVRAYSRTGVLTDAQGNAMAGARVEAVEPKSGKRRFSVTNSAGVYYLEGLQQGEYELQINGKSVGDLKLEGASEAFQELNLKQP